MKKLDYIIWIILVLSSCSKSKHPPLKDKKNFADSISYYSERFELKDLSDNERIKNLDKAVFLIKKSENSLKIRELNYELISKYYQTQSWENYKLASFVLLKNSFSSNDVISQAKAYRSLGNYYNETKSFDSSFYYYSKAEKIYKKINDFEGSSNIHLKKGIIQFNANDHLGAALSLSKALINAKKINDNSKAYIILVQLGLNSNQLKEYQESISYFKEALSIVNDNNLENRQYIEAVCLSNIGLVYQNLNEHKKAIYYFEKSLEYKNLENDFIEAYSNTLDNLAYSKLQLKDYNNLPQQFFKSLEIRKSLKYSPSIITSFIHISEYYRIKKDNKKSLEYANLALKLSRKEGTPIDLLYSLKQASLVDKEKSSKYSDDYLRISDSLVVVERNSKDRLDRIQLETDEIIKEKDDLVDKNRYWLYVFVGTVSLLSLLFLVRAQRARTRELLYKQTQQQANEEIYNLLISQQNIIDESRNQEKKKIARDLHDGILGRMFGARLNLDSLNVFDDEDSKNMRLHYLEELKEIEQDIREISHDLNREKLILINNFVSIVTNLLEEQKQTHAAAVTYDVDSTIEWEKISNVAKINSFRILQECLQNINKYANATEINVTIAKNEPNFDIIIKDNGIGFDVNKKSKGIGMQNMMARTNECNGSLDISSTKDKGTTIRLSIPIEFKKEIQKTDE